MDSERNRHKRQRRHEPPAQVCRDGPRSERERQHARLEIRFERVGTGLRDAMAKGQERSQRRDAKPRSIQRTARGDDRAEEQREAHEVSGEEDGLNGHAARTHERGDRVVIEHEPSLRVQNRSIAREQFGIEMLRDSWNVKRLVAHAVAIAGAVENGDEAKHTRACGERDAPNHAQRERILLDQMAVITPDSCA
jgi:hypothetical protein